MLNSILSKWKKADRLDSRFCLHYRPEQAENTSSWHHARSYHLFTDIRLQLMLDNPIFKNCYPNIKIFTSSKAITRILRVYNFKIFGPLKIDILIDALISLTHILKL